MSDSVFETVEKSCQVLKLDFTSTELALLAQEQDMTADQLQAMEEKISTAEGILLRINRSIQAEGVFSMIKQDMNFRRFMMRGKRNVTVEWHLLSIAYNILKLHHKAQTGRLGTHLIVPKTA